jgi:DNA polymerase-3 subunit alpha
MAFFQLEDQFGRVETIVFPKVYAREDENAGKTIAMLLEEAGDEPILVTGRLEVETDDEGNVRRYKLLMDSMQQLTAVRRERTSGSV